MSQVTAWQTAVVQLTPNSGYLNADVLYILLAVLLSKLSSSCCYDVVAERLGWSLLSRCLMHRLAAGRCTAEVSTDCIAAEARTDNYVAIDVAVSVVLAS